MEEILGKLKKLMAEDEAIYEITRMAGSSIYCIGPKVNDVNRIDVSGCIEDTLHRMLEAKDDENYIYAILKAMKTASLPEEPEDFCSTYYIDLGYVIFDFYPTSVIDTHIYYKRTSAEYTVYYWMNTICSHMDVYDEATDDEVLEAVASLISIDPGEFVVTDVRQDGSMYCIQSLLNEHDMFVLTRNIA